TDSPTSPSKNRFFRPATVHQYIIGLMNEINPAHHDFLQVEAYGLVTSQAKLISWVYDVLSIAPEIAEDEMRAALFVEELMLVEQINNLIKRALRNADMDERSIEYAEVLFLNQVQVGIFGEFQSGLATTDTSVDDWRESIIKNWRSKVNHIARDVFEKALDRNGTTAKLLEKSVKSRGVFYGQLKKKIAMREVQGNG
ncbi:MAG: type I-E CRISPR-associated protein Cse1/CasA, partial [Syntrophomonadaceae bacterium]|nr:type I-E CRISPR-associated protein Cse1/CasA [Syntrophomonadaceae bacterium]